MIPALAVALAILLAGPAAAHKASDSYLRLNVDAAGLAGQWDIALRDLERAVGLDADRDARVKLKQRQAAIAD